MVCKSCQTSQFPVDFEPTTLLPVLALEYTDSRHLNPLGHHNQDYSYILIIYC